MLLEAYLRVQSPIVISCSLLMVAGCTDRQYRYSGYVPASPPLAWDGRTTPHGHLRVEGNVSHARVVPKPNPTPDDTGVFVPETTAQAAISVGLEPSDYIGFEAGLRASYAHFAWSQASALGTMPIPSEPSVFGSGLEGRATFYLDRAHVFGIGVGLNWMAYLVPFAQWRAGCDGVHCVVLSNGTPYGLSDERHELHLFNFQFALYPSVGIGENARFGHVFAGFATTTGYSNYGFRETSAGDAAVRANELVSSVGAGYGLRVAPIHAAVMVYQPLTTQRSDIDYDLGGLAMLGVDFEIWTKPKKAGPAAPSAPPAEQAPRTPDTEGSTSL